MSETKDKSVLSVVENAKQQLEHMIDMHPEMMLLVGADGCVVRANRAVQDYLGIDDIRSLPGQRPAELFGCSAGLMAKLTDPSPGSRIIEETATVPGRGERLLQFSRVSPGGVVELCLLVVTDVTRRERESAAREKEHKREAISALTGALMHRINQPLTVIVVTASLMKAAAEAGPADRQQLVASLQEIIDLAQNISDIISQVEKVDDYVTQPYVADEHILDLERSSSDAAPTQPGAGLLDVLVNVAAVHMPDHTAHAQRVSRVAEFLAQALGCDPECVEVVKRAGMLHDIGKIGLPDALLQKTEPLTGEEREAVKEHVAIAEKLLRHFPFLAEEARAVCGHHERFDGEGYPEGLSGEAIPLSARIVAVADVFDVLRSGRAYSAAETLEDAVAELQRCAGREFDPAVVKAAVDHAADIDALFPAWERGS